MANHSFNEISAIHLNLIVFGVLIGTSCRSVSFQFDLYPDFTLVNRELQNGYVLTNFEQLWMPQIIILHKLVNYRWHMVLLHLSHFVYTRKSPFYQQFSVMVVCANNWFLFLTDILT